MLAFLTQKYQDSDNCKLELKFARQSGIPIVPVMLEVIIDPWRHSRHPHEQRWESDGLQLQWPWESAYIPMENAAAAVRLTRGRWGCAGRLMAPDRLARDRGGGGDLAPAAGAYSCGPYGESLLQL